MKSRLFTSGALCANAMLLAFAFPSGVASAQEAVSEKSDEIVVTARKRAEALQDVPASLTVVGASEATARGAVRVRDLEAATPNVLFTGTENNSLTRVSVRGLESQARQNVGTESGLGVYVDGVIQGRLTSFNQELPDLERVEFLRGPQGTLYGRNSIMGAINVITRQPSTDAPELDINVRLAEFNERVGSIYASAPLTDKIAGSAAVFAIQRDGYIQNLATRRDIGSDDTQGARVKLLIQPGGTWRITLAADALKDDSLSPTSRRIVGPGATSRPYTANVDVDPVSRRDVGGASATVEADVLGGHKLTSITAYRWANNDRSSDSDGTPVVSQVTFQESDQTQFSQELRLASPDGGRFDYIVGLYYFDQGIFGRTIGSIAGVGAASIFGDIDTRSFAAFGNLDVHLTKALTFNAGIRYTDEEKDLSYRQVGIPGFVPSIARAPDTQSDEDVSPTFGLRFKPNDNATLYLTASRGYRSGGWNVEPQTSAAITSWTQLRFGSEKLTSIEAGAKTSWFGDRLRVNAAVFDIDYQDLQVATRVPLPPPFAPGLFASVVSNAANASAKGAELEVLARPAANFSFGGNVGVVDTKYDDYLQPGVPPLSFAGKELNGAPDLTGGAFAEYRMKLASFGDLTARVDYRHVSDFFTERTNDPRNVTPASDVVNARLTYSEGKGRFRAAVFANNIADEEIIAGRISNAAGTIQTVDYARPRVVGVELGFSY